MHNTGRSGDAVRGSSFAQRIAMVSVVMPAHDEAAALPGVIDEVFGVLHEEGIVPEVLVVDDGSRDATRAIMARLTEDRVGLRYIRLSRCFGKEAALSAGLEHARGDAVILMDADGQHPASLIPRFIHAWRAGAPAVAAVQIKRSEPALQRWMKGWYYRIANAGSQMPLMPGAGDFRLLDRSVVEALRALPERNRFMKGLYAWVGFEPEWIAYEAAPRIAGRSRFGWSRLFGLGMTGLTSFSVAPLRLVSAAGSLVSLAALVYGAWLVFEHFFIGEQLPGWATLAVGMLLLSGVQLLALGVIGEYLGRVFEEVKQRPLYVVAEDTAADPATLRVRAAHPALGGSRLGTSAG
jgi:glycosyltransferase involved in cell wall biosynthesis